jgi:hypothetical protein
LFESVKEPSRELTVTFQTVNDEVDIFSGRPHPTAAKQSKICSDNRSQLNVRP